jgi:RES domain-containing protein
MVREVPRRDNSLIDTLEAIEPIEFEGRVWRIVRDGRDPMQFSASGGRWDDGTFDVLYTSLEAQGAIEEMRFHLMRGQPVMPSKVTYRLFEMEVRIDRALKLVNLDALAAIGFDTSRFGRLSYQDKSEEYPRTQQIGEVAHFLEFDGLIVPSARHTCLNAVLFGDRIAPDALLMVMDHGAVDWSTVS